MTAMMGTENGPALAAANLREAYERQRQLVQQNQQDAIKKQEQAALAPSSPFTATPMDELERHRQMAMQQQQQAYAMQQAMGYRGQPARPPFQQQGMFPNPMTPGMPNTRPAMPTQSPFFSRGLPPRQPYMPAQQQQFPGFPNVPTRGPSVVANQTNQAKMQQEMILRQQQANKGVNQNQPPAQTAHTTITNLLLLRAQQQKATPPPPPVKPLPWVENISKSYLPRWDKIERPFADLKLRMSNASLSENLITMKSPLSISAESGALFALNPFPQTIIADSQALIPLTPTTQSEESSHKYEVRLLLLTGPAQTPNSSKTHFNTRVYFTVIKDASDGSLQLPGGEWDPQVDGGVAGDSGSLATAAVRHARDSLGIDISSCLFHRFAEFTYSPYNDVFVETVVMVPEIWNIEELPLVAHHQIEDVEEEVEEEIIENVLLTPEEIEEQQKEWDKKMLEERKKGERDILGEREADKLERLANMEDKISKMAKEAKSLPTTKPVTKKVMVPKKSKQIRRIPTLMSLQEILADKPQSESAKEIFLCGYTLNELLKQYYGIRIIDCIRDYTERKAIEFSDEAKRKREEENSALEAERMAKRQRAAERQAVEIEKMKLEKEKGILKEAELLERQIILEERIRNLPPPDETPEKRSRTITETNEEHRIAFSYFDTGSNGTIKREDIMNVLQCSYNLSYRQTEDMLIPKPTSFSYMPICSQQKVVVEEVEVEKVVPAA